MFIPIYNYNSVCVYNVGDLTFYNETYYTCNTNGTTGDFNVSLWDIVQDWNSDTYYVIVNFDSDSIRYSSSTQYYTNDVVFYSNKYYKCIDSCIGVSPLNTTNWKQVLFGGTYAMYNGNCYKCINSHLSESDFKTDSSNWEIIDITVFMQIEKYKRRRK